MTGSAREKEKSSLSCLSYNAWTIDQFRRFGTLFRRDQSHISIKSPSSKAPKNQE